ncbi:hypothetical protein C5B42_05095 [Candidatus Cerribacteria bacterium 'Amazon FNV 2010 28 9']|uniref:Uncharacterized protein n=1 Tax=Candidatus Cerribacteria bacterium 'Amazon FNV 2010 28 9' TaxID=2081795 RepID=A0A317JRP4_9BACT|nr:MAG: hypothetical protein C5B42_05095 [Candidatus Cerribacteria bacterium 'Amazon FNV 2010 28 9']
MKKSVRIFQWSFLRICFVLVTGVFFLSLGSHNQTHSLNLTSVTDTLSTSRFSWVGRLAAGNISGSSIVTLDTTANEYESTSSGNLFTNDTVAIGNGAAIVTNDTVKNILSLSQFEISPALTSSQTTAGMFIIATRSATHTLSFTTASAVPNGAFRVLIPTISNATNAKDGIPDRGGFDFSATTPTVTCPSSVGATYNFVGGTATASAVVVGSTTYHAFECRYSGTGAIGQSFTGFTINSLINPAPNSGHTDGFADSYTYLVQNLDSTHSVVDQTTGAIAVVESVRVTATVDPQITFRIFGVNSGTSVCGLTTSVTTTATTVPFGSVSISSFTSAAQGLTVATNATNGFAVTALENDQLGRNGNVCTGGGPSFSNPCIPDSAGDNGLMTSSVTDTWNNNTTVGFAYTLADPNSSTTPAFTFSTGYRKFADNENSVAAQTIFSGSSVASNQNVFVCYKIIVAPTQQAGDYTNNITYRATATF